MPSVINPFKGFCYKAGRIGEWLQGDVKMSEEEFPGSAGVQPWPRKISHAKEQLSPRATASEPAL